MGLPVAPLELVDICERVWKVYDLLKNKQGRLEEFKKHVSVASCCMTSLECNAVHHTGRACTVLSAHSAPIVTHSAKCAPVL